MALALSRRGSGPPLVLIHGVGTHRAVWRRLVPHLESAHTVISLDVPGFGESAPDGPGFDLNAIADRVAEGVADEASGGYDLLGHSLGGAIALKLAVRHPATVERLILSAPAGFAPRSAAIARVAGAIAEPALAARRVIGTPLSGHALARRVLLSGAVHDGSRMEPDDARLLLTASREARSLSAAVREVAAADLREDLRGLTVPVGVVWGERDAIISPKTLDALRSVRTELEVETIPNAGHVSQLERPAELAGAIERLLARLAA